MRPFSTKKIFLALSFLIGILTQTEAQSVTVSGTITDSLTKAPLAGVSITVKGKVLGTTTDTKGNFLLTTNTPPPFILTISSVGYKTLEQEITSSKSDLTIEMTEQVILGQEVVVAASRVEESVLQSPVTIEKLDLRSIRYAATPSFFDALINLKGVEMSSQSLLFRSINTRGFNSNGNTRVVQLIDGMDNQAPGLNFAVGNVVGISELDLESVEMLPGAASALYGPNAINGIILMNSKNPFQYQGLSGYAKAGIMNESNRSQATTPFYDFALRYAKAFNDKIAFKINVNYLTAKDWQATDTRDQSLLNGSSLSSTQQTNPGYNGINTYGDETNVNLYTSLYGNGQPGTGAGGTSQFLGAIATTQIPQAGNKTLPELTGLTPQQLFNQMIPNIAVSRTGYAERDLANYNTHSLKLSGALHWRITEGVEAILQANYGTGTTVYTGSDRYSLANFNLGQYKAEVRGSNFFVRTYTTQENSGDSYAIGVLGSGVNEAWKPSTTWFPQYFGAYATGAFQTYATALLVALASGQSGENAIAAAQAAAGSNAGTLHNQARGVADQGRLVPGTTAFNDAVSAIKSRPIPGNSEGVGAQFTDKTNMYHVEGMYNFNKLLSPAMVEIIVGGNYRLYTLNSNKTLFATDDNGNEFKIHEYGGYIQGGKKLLEDKLKLTASVRYDKNQNFKGQFNPRASAVLTLAKVHNIRASFQTGFRIPTTQAQYIDLLTPQSRILGGLPIFRERYNMVNNPVYTLQSVQAFGAAVQQGQNPQQAAALLQQHIFRDYQPERVRTVEVGYKGLISNRLFIDAYYYYNTFVNFDGGQVVVQDIPNDGVSSPISLLSSTTRSVYSFPVNVTQNLNNHGWALGIDYLLPKNFTVGGNVSYNKLLNTDKLPAGFETAFNTPEYRYNLSFGNRNVIKNLGFSLTWRWQDQFVWQSSFVGGVIRGQNKSIVPAYGTLDAQVNYKVTAIKSIIKLGGSNILNKGYTQSWGNPTFGGMYYVSILFDQFMN
ncbi:TonB-dependent receptor [Cytophagaceae bacterium DM2B3-1]|uniref:TonB-dependent receptor n=1 Tax=Xanthocytophaga flava TaxID=3048013 RepID=A0ABT7CSZ2_9BACT|nr:TonB-dependent receptor [Xanthocytophaga flavus]MDJ1496842.1 TonB-dependent receptor [Xanthocytophaga flavus]